MVAVAVAALPALARGQRGGDGCVQPHYRWSQKIDTTLVGRVPIPTSVGVVLSTWDPPRVTRNDRCALRAGREGQVYVLTGWVRRFERAKDDGDWHIEVTERQQSPADSCLVAEIPPAALHRLYAAARSDLERLIATSRVKARGTLDPPVRVRLTGAAFFDGQHRLVSRHGEDRGIQGHGRCNASLRALWEIHPVYRVEPP